MHEGSFDRAKDELRNAVNMIAGNGEIRLASLACGSAESVIEIMAEAKTMDKMIKAVFVDKDGDALENARRIAKHYGVENQIEMISIFCFWMNQHKEPTTLILCH